MEIYEKYKKESEKYTQLYLLGRLAEYKHVGMDEAIINAFNMFEKIKGNYTED